MVNLSRLEEIKDLRTVWPHEALRQNFQTSQNGRSNLTG